MSTPPPAAIRARTPPTPLHGPQYDDYEPYSPRRSKRSTAQRNPYSSFNGERSPGAALARNITPPNTAKRARFAHAPPQLFSPPSSPASPDQRHSLHRTPRKQRTNNLVGPANGTLSDSDRPSHSRPPSHIDPTTMLPTPSKTPKKRVGATVTARVLSFQPGSPSDVMPTSRKIKKQAIRHHIGAAGFELYEDEGVVHRSDEIEVYTDTNARVPEMDESEDNPFVGPRKRDARPQRRLNKKGVAELEREQRMDDAVRRGEGVTYVFRGKRIFRKFDVDDDAADAARAVGADLGNTPEQRRLKHSAGAAAQRPLTRSAIKPRLLFTSDEERMERDRRAQEVDEEAITDIEMSHANSPVDGDEGEDVSTPVQDEFQAVTTRAKRPKPKGNETVLATQSTAEAYLGGGSAAGARVRAGRKSGGGSPFETWQRTKPGGSKKRAVEETEPGSASGKRSRSNVGEGGG